MDVTECGFIAKYLLKHNVNLDPYIPELAIWGVEAVSQTHTKNLPTIGTIGPIKCPTIFVICFPPKTTHALGLGLFKTWVQQVGVFFVPANLPCLIA
jgi:hypothetical protein